MRRLLLLLTVALAVALSVVSDATWAQVNSAPPGMPANVQAIMKRLESGMRPTPAEQKILQDYMAKAAASAGASAGGSTSSMISSQRVAASASAASGGLNPHQPTMTASGIFRVGTGQAQNPCHAAGKAIGFGKTPSQGDYVAMAKDALHVYRAHLTAQGQTSLDTVLGQAPAGAFGAALAPIFVLHGNGSAAVVSAAYAAEKAPTDVVAANNLGATLRGLHDYARAALALQYALSLSPKNMMVANNLGWLAFGQGDQRAAGQFFAIAVKTDNKLSPSLLGQGLIAQCAGQPAKALPLLRASIANGYSEAAGDAVDSADNLLSGENDPSADNASPDVYDSGSGGGGAGGDMPNWQDPPFAHDPAEFSSGYQAKPNPLRDYIDKYITQLVTDAHDQAVAAGPKVKGGGTTGTGRNLTFTRGNAKEVFEIGDIIGIISRETAPLIDKFSTDVANAVQQDGCHSCVGAPPIQPQCSAQGHFRSIHGGLASEEQSQWTQLRKDMADLYGFTGPLIAQIRDSNLSQVETASLQTWAAMQMTGFTATMPQWQAEGWLAYDPSDCGQKTPAPLAQGKLKPYKVDPTACHSGKLSMNMGFANLNADCSKMSLTIGEGLVGAMDWKFAPDYTKMADGSLRPTGTDWSNDQITIFVGAGGAAAGPLGANGAVGGFVTVQNGQVMDAGGQAQVGVSPGVAGGDVSLQAGATGRVGMMSGPDVSTSGSVRIGAPCGVSC